MAKSKYTSIPLGKYTITKRNKDGMYSATMLLNQYNRMTAKKKEVTKFLHNENIRNLLDYFICNGYKHPYISSRGSRGGDMGTWMIKPLFINFMLWLSPYFNFVIKVDFLNGMVFLPDNQSSDEYKTYLMTDSNTNYTKIGKSKNPKYREGTLQSEKPTISMIAISDLDVESQLHNEYSEKRVRGEWFDLSATEISNIVNDYNFSLI